MDGDGTMKATIELSGGENNAFILPALDDEMWACN